MFSYTKIESDDEGTARFKIEEAGGFFSCVVDDENYARLFCATPDLLDALKDLVARDRAEAAECGFADDEMSWLEDARRAIAKAEAGAT